MLVPSEPALVCPGVSRRNRPLWARPRRPAVGQHATPSRRTIGRDSLQKPECTGSTIFWRIRLSLRTLSTWGHGMSSRVMFTTKLSPCSCRIGRVVSKIRPAPPLSCSHCSSARAGRCDAPGKLAGHRQHFSPCGVPICCCWRSPSTGLIGFGHGVTFIVLSPARQPSG